MHPQPGSLYVAMGSSFAAGPGITPVLDRSALRSGRNYAHQVAESLQLTLTDVTYSGATTAHILTTPQNKRRPQIEAVAPNTALVTITAGGNDLGYVGSMLVAGAVGTVVRRLPFLPASRREQLGDLVGFSKTPATTPEAFAAVAAAQAEIVERVRERAPRARILLIDYLTLVDTPPSDRTPALTTTQQATASEIGLALAEAFRTAAERSGAELIAASAASVGHGVGSSDPWVHGFAIGIPSRGGPMPYHPTLTGMTRVAELVIEAVGPSAVPEQP